MLFYSHSEAETERLAASFAADLAAGMLVGLVGPLGAGKTRFVKGLVRGLGGRPDEAVSPTFTIVQPLVCGGRILYHFDLYRLENRREMARLLDEEFLPERGLAVVEWFDKLGAPAYPCSYLVHLDLVPGEPASRQIRVEKGPGQKLKVRRGRHHGR